MKPSDDPELDLRAMQAALGLPEEGDASVDGGGPELESAKAYWAARFQPLLEIADPVAPPGRLWDRIATDTYLRTEPRAADRRTPAPSRRFWDNVAAWRWATCALAACLVLALLTPMQRALRVEPVLIAVLQSPGAEKAGFLVRVAADGIVQLTPLERVAIPDGRAMQFWTKADADPGPTSLGLVPGDAVTRVAFPGERPPAAGQLFELTLEPPGGSPIGRPTGPILFIGRAIAPG